MKDHSFQEMAVETGRWRRARSCGRPFSRLGRLGFLLVFAIGSASTAEELPYDYHEDLPRRDLPSRRILGPMIGHVTPSAATIWMQGDRDFVYGVLHWEDDGSPSRSLEQVLNLGRRPETVLPQGRQGVVKYTLAELKPSTRYRYAIFDLRADPQAGEDISALTRPHWSGRFTTAPLAGPPGLRWHFPPV